LAEQVLRQVSRSVSERSAKAVRAGFALYRIQEKAYGAFSRSAQRLLDQMTKA
jgi:hypothetical protein